MDYLYLIPLIIAFLIGLGAIISTTTREKKLIEKPFLNEFSNELYALSFSIPFKFFINPNENDKKIKELKSLITTANEGHRINYRVYVTLQICILLISICLFGLINLLINYSSVFIKILFNIEMNTDSPEALIKLKFFVGSILLFLVILPKMYLKRKAKKNRFAFTKDLPILQLFIILMFKSKRPLTEVLYVLSTTNTIYKNIFSIAYRKFISNKQEGIDFLKTSFAETKFEKTINVLESYGEYSKEKSLIVLESDLKDLVEYVNTFKRRKDIGANVFSQLSLAFPFLAVVLLGFSPLINYGLNLLSF